MRRGGIVHDIGKVAVPEFVLLKPGPLDPAERKIMEEHTVIGERICAPLKSFRNVLPIIRSHHEKQDGTGYPDHLKGEEIPLTARILQTVDIYDSLTTDRPYRKALSQEKALEIMWEETRRGWWDAELVGALEELLQESPLAFTEIAPEIGLVAQASACGVRQNLQSSKRTEFHRLKPVLLTRAERSALPKYPLSPCRRY